MASFTVHTPALAAGEQPSPEKIVFLRDGFSWPALLFGPLWLAWNRAWLAAAVCFVAMLVLSVAGAKLGLSEEALSLVNIAIGVALGFEGSRLIAWTPARRGYREAAVVSADNRDEAEEIYFHNVRHGQAPAPSPGGGLRDNAASREQEGRAA